MDKILRSRRSLAVVAGIKNPNDHAELQFLIIQRIKFFVVVEFCIYMLGICSFNGVSL